MKNRAKCALCCLIAALLGTLSGCQLAQADKGAEAGADRLIGVFVTAGHLDSFDMEAYMNDNLKVNANGEITVDGSTQAYQGRLYATQKKRTVTDGETGATSGFDTYVFEGVEGMSCFEPLVPATAAMDCYYTTIADDAVSDRKTNLAFGDKENSVTLEGTIYASTGRGEVLFYFNPVYQDAGGRVYVTGGTGSASSGEDGDKFGYDMNATQTVTENGKVKKDSTSVKINVQVMDPPTKIAVLQMDASNAVLSRTEFTPGTLPKQITPEQAVDYIVVEMTQSGADGKQKVTRKLYGKEDNTLESFWYRGEGICAKQSTQVLWPDAAALPVS